MKIKFVGLAIILTSVLAFGVTWLFALFLKLPPRYDLIDHYQGGSLHAMSEYVESSNSHS